jgi:hypothetical protein
MPLKKKEKKEDPAEITIRDVLATAAASQRHP